MKFSFSLIFNRYALGEILISFRISFHPLMKKQSKPSLLPQRLVFKLYKVLLFLKGSFILKVFTFEGGWYLFSHLTLQAVNINSRLFKVSFWTSERALSIASASPKQLLLE